MSKFNCKKIAMGLTAPIIFSSFCVSNLIGMEDKKTENERVVYFANRMSRNALIDTEKAITTMDYLIKGENADTHAEFIDKTLKESAESTVKIINIYENDDLLSKENELITDSKKIMTKLKEIRDLAKQKGFKLTKFETYMVSKDILKDTQILIELVNLMISDKKFEVNGKNSETIDKILSFCAESIVILGKSNQDNNIFDEARNLDKKLRATKTSAENQGFKFTKLKEYID